jgi:predicted dehydrogenase
MATLRDAAQVAQRLEELGARLQSELTDGDVDFTALMRLADEAGESADALASAFAAMDEALVQRLTGRNADQEAGDANEGGTARRQRQRQRRQQPARRGGDEENETKDELLERAREAGIEGRSAMSKDDLRKAVTAEDSLSKEELLERAREADIPGRSEMSKEELKEALRSA